MLNMPRIVTGVVPNYINHITQRGNYRQNTFQVTKIVYGIFLGLMRMARNIIYYYSPNEIEIKN